MKNDTGAIVKEFLELWQKQCAYMSRDGESASQAFEAFRKMQEAYVDSIGSGLGNTENVKSTAASDLFGNIGNEFIKLARSHAKLEARVAMLESRLAGGMGEPAKKTPATRPKRAGKRTAKADN